MNEPRFDVVQIRHNIVLYVQDDGHDSRRATVPISTVVWSNPVPVLCDCQHVALVYAGILVDLLIRSYVLLATYTCCYACDIVSLTRCEMSVNSWLSRGRSNSLPSLSTEIEKCGSI